MSSATRLSPQDYSCCRFVVVAVGIGHWLAQACQADSNSESTNDAYVEADFTLVAPRIAGQISDVFVDDNQSGQSRAIAGTY
jgi:membrane fusion protein (multidrug efflux system)